MTLKNRQQEWITLERPEDGPALRAKVQQAMVGQESASIPGMLVRAVIFDFAPYAEVTVRVEDISSVRFIPGVEADASPETGSGAETAP